MVDAESAAVSRVFDPVELFIHPVPRPSGEDDREVEGGDYRSASECLCAWHVTNDAGYPSLCQPYLPHSSNIFHLRWSSGQTGSPNG